MNINKIFRIANALAERNPDEEFIWGTRAGDSEVPVIIANWNNFDNKVSDMFVRMGAEVWWSDEYLICDNCGGLIDTHPTHYGWEPDYLIFDGFATCRECIEEEFEGDPKEDWEVVDFFRDWIYDYHYALNGQAKAIHSWLVPIFEKHGWECWSEENENLCKRYETGFHPGQTDNPVKEFKEIMKIDKDLRVVFAIDSTGQFDVDWHILVKPKVEVEQ